MNLFFCQGCCWLTEGRIDIQMSIEQFGCFILEGKTSGSKSSGLGASGQLDVMKEEITLG